MSYGNYGVASVLDTKNSFTIVTCWYHWYVCQVQAPDPSTYTGSTCCKRWLLQNPLTCTSI